jgi:putative membrane protein
MRIILALVGNALALLATTIVPGIIFKGDVLTLAVAGAIFGLFNLIIRPLAMLLSLPLLIVTLGLFYFILNGILLYVASLLIPGYTIAGFVPALIGSLVVTVVNWLLHALFGKK